MLLAGSVCAAALAGAPVAHSAILNISVFDNGGLVGIAPPSINGIATFNASAVDDPNFSSINVRADGPPILPGGDLSTVTLNISAASTFTGTHILTIDVFQTGVLLPAGTTTDSTFTVNNLIGTPGPTVETDYFNGTSSTLGTLLNTASFPAGTVTESIGPIANFVGPALTADAQQYMITLNAPIESANDTIQLITSSAVPEPSTWAMMVMGFAGLGFAAYRGRRRAISTV
jgi:hypothetical protein